MVKKAEVEHKRSPMLPVYGAITAVVLGAVSYALASWIVLQPRISAIVSLETRGTARLAFAFVIWLLLLGISYFLVSLLVGKDPDNAKDMPLPIKQKDLPKEQRRGYRKR